MKTNYDALQLQDRQRHTASAVLDLIAAVDSLEVLDALDALDSLDSPDSPLNALIEKMIAGRS